MKYLTVFIIQSVLAIIIYIVIMAKDRAENKKKIKQNTTPKPVIKEVKPQNVLTYTNNGKEYKARFENGTVYAISKYVDDFVIGYYALEEGKWKVRCAYDKGEIATIDKDDTSALIFFNRLGDLERNKRILMQIAETGGFLTKEELERQHNESARRTKLTYLCAEVFGTIVEDMDTREVVATSTSKDVIGNAAAFTCLQYDVVMEGKYHDFYSPIK